MALDASGLPQLDDGSAVRSGADGLRTAVDRVWARAQSIQATWSAIAPHYDAPEAGLVHTAMDQPVTSAATLVAKTSTAAGALSTYGDRLDELNAQRAQLVADIAAFNAHRAEVTSETNGFLGWKEWTGWEKQDLLNKEEALNDRCAAFAAAVDEAQRTCANAISAIYGGVQYKAADRASVDDEFVYGLSEDGYDQLGLSGQNAWGAPEGWTDVSWLSAGFMVGRGAVRSVTGVYDMGKALTGFGEDGEASAAWSGLWQLTKDAAVFTSTPLLMTSLATDPDGTRESGERLLGVGKSMLGIGTWQTSGWNTAGGFVPDIALAVVTAGGGAAVKGGLGGAAKGTLSGSLARLAPTSAASIGDLSTALRAGMRTDYGDALAGIRDLGYRGIDPVADVRRAAEVPGSWADAGRGAAGPPTPRDPFASTRAAAAGAGDVEDLVKTYRLMDGTEHVVRFGSRDPFNLGLPQRGAADALLGSGEDVGGVYARNGVEPWTRQQLIDRITTDPAKLTETDRAVLNDLRDTVTVDRDTVMQKALTRDAFEDYILGRSDARPPGHPLGERGAFPLFDPATVGGSVARYDDVRHLRSPDALYDGLRLDYAGSPFEGQGDVTHVLRYQSRDRNLVVPRSSWFDPLHSGDPRTFDALGDPFTGNGFTKATDTIVPEFQTTGPATMDPGAEIWEVLPDGTERLAAVLRRARWVPVA